MKSWQYIRGLALYRPDLYLLSGLLASVVGYVFPLIPGLIVRRFFDVLTNQAQAGLNPTSLMVLLVVAGLLRSLNLIGATAVERTLQLTTAALLRKNTFARILTQPGARAVPASPGEAISRFRNDVEYIVGFLSWTLDPVGQGIVMLIALIVLIQIDPLITVIVLLPLFIVFAIVNQARRRIQTYRRLNQEAIGEVTGLLGEIFGAVQAVKVANAERHVAAYLQTLNEARRRAALNDLLFTNLLGSLSANLANLGTGVLLLVAAQAMQDGHFTVGDFALVVSYIAWLTQVTSMFGDFLSKYRQTEVSLDRLLSLLSDAPDGTLVRPGAVYPQRDKTFGCAPSRELPSLDRLTANGLSYRFPDSGRGIAEIDLRLERGTFTVVTGRIGSGKTTLLRVLLGLLPRDAGEIQWNG
ncbi:MAG TPA: ABC transporter ATP-binding protein, partial [Chloroflexota bacterium]|nr:ABC transporter ATP-binding protein [Chloroflexota bacterium]